VSYADVRRCLQAAYAELGAAAARGAADGGGGGGGGAARHAYS